MSRAKNPTTKRPRSSALALGATRPARGVPGQSAPPSPRTVLLAVTGSSPAVLTETIWALAHESPPVVPDRVVVVTTTDGARTLRDHLLTPLPAWDGQTCWQSLRHSLLGKIRPADTRLTLETPVLISAPDPATGCARELADIRTPGDNAAAAETILAAVRRFSTDADTRLIGLLAGGRKTMGALLHAALSLAGRPGDRLLHVLVNEPFDHSRLAPPFYFPGQPGPAEHRLPGADGLPVPQTSARIDLADVPLVALGELVAAQTGRSPATFAALARSAGDAVSAAGHASRPLRLAYDPKSRILKADTASAALPRGRCAALAAHLFACARADAEHLRNADLLESLDSAQIAFDYNGSPRAFTPDDVNKALNELRDALKKLGGEALVRRLLPLRQPVGLNREGVDLAD